MSASRIHRPTENTAIGRCRKPPQLWPDQIRFDMELAKQRLDRFGQYLLRGRLDRALNPTRGER